MNFTNKVCIKNEPSNELKTRCLEALKSPEYWNQGAFCGALFTTCYCKVHQVLKTTSFVWFCLELIWHWLIDLKPKHGKNLSRKQITLQQPKSSYQLGHNDASLIFNTWKYLSVPAGILHCSKHHTNGHIIILWHRILWY